MFKGLGNLASLMKQASAIQGKMGEMTEQLKSKRVVGTSGAGMVSVEADGAGQILKVTVDPAAIDEMDLEMIQDLLPAAINQAIDKSKQLHLQMMQEMTGGLNIPGLDTALQEIVGDGSGEDEPRQ